MSQKRFHPYSLSQANADAGNSKTDNSTSKNKTKPTTSKNANNDKALSNITNTNSANSKTSLLKKPSTSTSKAKLFNVDMNLGEDDDYENQDYYSNFNKPAQKINYPTMNQPKTSNTSTKPSQKGILKGRTNSQKNADNSKKNASKTNGFQISSDNASSIKFYSATTKSIRFFTNKIELVNEQAMTLKRPGFGSYLFEIIAQLDSSVSDGFIGYSREFTIKDNFERMHCIFCESDRCLSKLARGSWIRCVGKLNVKTNIFQSVSVRMATQEECFRFGYYVNQTNSHLKKMLV